MIILTTEFLSLDDYITVFFKVIILNQTITLLVIPLSGIHCKLGNKGWSVLLLVTDNHSAPMRRRNLRFHRRPKPEERGRWVSRNRKNEKFWRKIVLRSARSYPSKVGRHFTILYFKAKKVYYFPSFLLLFNLLINSLYKSNFLYFQIFLNEQLKF
jgi:hypothetical protein